MVELHHTPRFSSLFHENYGLRRDIRRNLIIRKLIFLSWYLTRALLPKKNAKNVIYRYKVFQLMLFSEFLAWYASSLDINNTIMISEVHDWEINMNWKPWTWITLFLLQFRFQKIDEFTNSRFEKTCFKWFLTVINKLLLLTPFFRFYLDICFTCFASVWQSFTFKFIPKLKPI